MPTPSAAAATEPRNMSALKHLRILLVLPALLALLLGVFSGLARLGLVLPAWVSALSGVHSALMVGGFFGSLIGMERAVAMRSIWPYGAPLMSGSAVFALCLGNSPLAALLLCCAALFLCCASVTVWRQQPVAHLATLALGALAWLIGNLIWAWQGHPFASVAAWAAFLLLTIAGERLELSRFLPTPKIAKKIFLAICALMLLSATLSAVTAQALTAFAVSLLALAIWLLRYDIARHTVRAKGLTRYMAWCLLSGYAWLALAGMLGTAGAFQIGHIWRDAALHALLLGFVFAMVFGHAPIILPALTRLKLPWHPVFYLPLVSLQLSLLWRLMAGLLQDFAMRQQAGTGNAISIALFFFIVLGSLIAGTRLSRHKPTLQQKRI